MEPSLGEWARNREEAERRLRDEFINFLDGQKKRGGLPGKVYNQPLSSFVRSTRGIVNDPN